MEDFVSKENKFSSLEGNLTKEQLDEYHQMRSSTAGLVESSDNTSHDDIDVDVSALESLASVATFVQEKEQVIEVQVERDQVVDGSSTQTLFHAVDPSTSMMTTIDVNSELTIKYLKGEVEFVEFMKQMFYADKEAEPEEGGPDLPAEADNLHVDQPADDTIEMEEEPSASTSQEPDSPKKRKKRTRKLHSRLPKDLQGLMGEANLMFARGKRDEAIKMCMEVIRLAPNAPEPFQTLGMLYEELDDTDKAMQFHLIGAHLAPSDSDQWCKLAEMAIELGKLKDACQYYTKAIRYDHDNTNLIFQRSQLYQEVGDMHLAIDGFHNVLRLLPQTEGERYLQLARDLTKKLHGLKKIPEAIQTMEKTFEKHQDKVTSEDVNLLVELYMSQQNYKRPMALLVESCGAVLTTADGRALDGTAAKELVANDEERGKLKSVEISEQIPIDLRVKLVLCLIHLMMLKVVPALLAPLFDESPNDMGDLYLDVAEAFMEKSVYKQAKPILATLVHSDSYNLAAVWFIYGECLNALGEQGNAAEAFKHVVELAPQHFGARVSLSAIQQQLGKPEEALRALTQETGKIAEEITGQDMRLLLHKTLLLHSQGKLEEFLDLSKKMLFSHFKDILQPGHLSVILNFRTRKHRKFALKQMLGSGTHSRLQGAPCFDGNSALPLDDVWELYLKVCNTLVNVKRYDEFEDLAIIALTVPQFNDDASKAKESEFICLMAFILNNNGNYAYNFIKEFCLKEVENHRAWNLFSQTVTIAEHQRHNKFLIRLMLKHPNNIAIGLLNAHQSLVGGNYKYALTDFISAYRQMPRDPLISLSIGVTFIQLASIKFAMKRHLLLTQACVFLNKYMELRGECQESFYNMGRAFHQLGLYHVAIHYYDKVLTLPCPVEDERGLFDLKRDAAFNLCQIYKNSKSDEMVHYLMQEYLVV
ncbi:general transcription factor 3C polypeptide 3-like isoform X1 [Lineus longissimus]|uniref:general transcription factor 3C polypeptide 3-like isoform X1 n=1 Tax=Lineus longissimus TaxID=88925 RepID=UPI00315D459E